MVKLWPHQRLAADKLSNGTILVGGTGSGKSLTGLAYFFESVLGGSTNPLTTPERVMDLYIITTSKKRDSMDWVGEAAHLGISTDPTASVGGIKMHVDSWNNIKKYVGVVNAFFIFDEQRTVGSGVWAKSFIKIAKKNQWIMLSATPADRWTDLVPVFIANGFYRNKTAFAREHILYSPYTKYPTIRGYLDVPKLNRFRDLVYVVMPFKRKTTAHIVPITVEHDRLAVKRLLKTEWNPFKNTPIRNNPEFRHVMFRIINSHPSRMTALLNIHANAKKLIVFYNFNYELDIMRTGFELVTSVSEYNGHKHDPIPMGDNWVYLVQYTSGNEAWECFTTNHMAQYSLNYSYRVTIQSMGRIDRMTTLYTHLYYYQLVSDSVVDKGLRRSYNKKKDFNMRALRLRPKQESQGL